MRRALVTGASGIGSAICHKLYQMGYQVTVLSKSKASLESLMTEIPVTTVQVDMGNLDDVEAVAEELDQIPFDVIVNNAGVFVEKLAHRFTPQEITESMNVNLLAPMILTKTLTEKLAARRGHIFNICSTASKNTYRNGTVYSTSKAGLYHWSKTHALELRDKGVKVTSILPGMVETGMHAGSSVDSRSMLKISDIANAMEYALLAGPLCYLSEIVIEPTFTKYAQFSPTQAVFPGKRTLEYNGKHFTVPVYTPGQSYVQVPDDKYQRVNPQSLIYQDLNTVWDLNKFKQPRRPIVIDRLYQERDLMKFSDVRVLDMPIKFPGSDYRVPEELRQFLPIIQKITQHEVNINPRHEEYYCYLTIDQHHVKRGTLHREAPCHVDGFQGARQEKTLINHTYTVEDALPTTYYPQPFDFSLLDERKHDFFWEMNRQVAATNSGFAIRNQPFDIVLMDAYCVHRGSISECDRYRTFIRISYEVRIFDRLGNGHNPMFDYSWPMVERDIESLGLVPFDPTCDESLRVFPHHNREMTGNKAMPNLTPGDQIL